jgi:flagellar basal body rod protein FlgG
MVAAQKWLDVITHNLANASTNGFKRDGITFANAVERQMAVQGGVIGTLGTGSVEKGEYSNFEVGSMVPTKNPLDVAITTEKGLFAVQLSKDRVGYTRDGSFALNQDRGLVTKSGYPVLDDQLQPIQLPPGSITIGADGSIDVNGKFSAKLGVYDGSFSRLGGNVFRELSTPTPIQAELNPQTIESSNVNPIECMIQMITINRSFELAQKSMTQQDDLTQRLIQSLQEH